MEMQEEKYYLHLDQDITLGTESETTNLFMINKFILAFRA